MRITPALIPHDEFYTGIWLLPEENHDWYYFMKKSNKNIVSNKHFLKTVDKPLRKLVKFLHQRGIRTTPSCSGHHISERNLEKIYDSLQEDMEIIRTRGLRLKDVETGKIYSLKDRNYSLPWSRNEFIERVSTYQQKGVIGLRFRKLRNAKALVMNIKINGVRIEEKDGIVFIFTNEDNKGDNRYTWKQITKAVKRAFGNAKKYKLASPEVMLVPS